MKQTLLLVSLVEKSDLPQNVSETLNDLPIRSGRRAQFVLRTTLVFQTGGWQWQENFNCE